MSKPHKVEEPAAAYHATPAPAVSKVTETRAEVRHAKSADVRRVNQQLMQVHRKVLQKLAQ